MVELGYWNLIELLWEFHVDESRYISDDNVFCVVRSETRDTAESIL